MKRSNLDLSIVISTFNTKELLKKTLSSVYKQTKGIKSEIIVIDDASRDSTSDMVKKYFPGVKLIINKKNLGYSKSYNLGTKKSSGKYILHLNSDVEIVGRNPFRKMLSFMNNNKDVGMLGCKIIKSDGLLDLPCKRSFPTPLNIFYQSLGLAKIFPKSRNFGVYYLTYLNEDSINDVDCIMGAFMLIRRQVLKTIGYLDEMFFIYGEDIDYCYRVKNGGWRIVYYPEVIVRHLHGGTTRNFRLKFIWHFHYSMYQYYNKHYANKNNFVLNHIVYAGITVRFLGVAIIDYLRQ